MTDTAPVVNDDPSQPAPTRQTAADRRALPNLNEIAESAAEHEGVCARMIPMRAFDRDTGRISYIGVPCKSTIATVCPACAKAARYTRMVQCKEGWTLAVEPVRDEPEVTAAQRDLLGARAHMATEYHNARQAGDDEAADAIRELVGELDTELKESGARGPFPSLDPKPRRKAKSTRRRDDVPDLPRKKVAKRTVGREYAGKYRPSTFFTLTLPSYGRINEVPGPDGQMVKDGSPVHPDSYDYTRAARDTIHLKRLFTRWVQNLRRAVGWNVQYFATVEPQKRGAPHLHIAMRGTVPNELLKQVTAATYRNIWWPHHDHEVYTDDRMPVWDHQANTFTDPDTGAPLTTWDEALAVMDTVDELEPAHTLRFGAQCKTVQILAGSDEEDRKVRYLTKYLTKSVAEILEPGSTRVAVHYDRLQEELKRTPCSKTCAVWLRFGIVPEGASAKTVAGRCKGKAHRRECLGLPGQRVISSGLWTGKSVEDHRADRAEFVRQYLAAAGITLPERPNLRITPIRPGDKDAPPRAHLVMAAVADRIRKRAEYDAARLALAGDGPPGAEILSAIQRTAA
ncbi:helitron helicase-like domain-containing protein [Nocardia asteroides]|uniref:helitron helicase-like domain-containing protein n=1 Tax=Nocardia asteroides TaxID=1824 RepID=UPI001E2DFDC3|nr:helitron helicase-like domain-containing protein [Nocardia asteroides]UGT63403.1 helitron helicase-like domain-containing protein [Nocardia asteroides]